MIIVMHGYHPVINIFFLEHPTAQRLPAKNAKVFHIPKNTQPIHLVRAGTFITLFYHRRRGRRTTSLHFIFSQKCIDFVKNAFYFMQTNNAQILLQVITIHFHGVML